MNTKIQELLEQIKQTKEELKPKVTDIFGNDLEKLHISDDLQISVYIKKGKSIVTEYDFERMADLGYIIRSIHFKDNTIVFIPNKKVA